MKTHSYKHRGGKKMCFNVQSKSWTINFFAAFILSMLSVKHGGFSVLLRCEP